MTLFTAMLLFQSATPAQATAEPPPEEVTVVAQRLKRFRAIMRRDKATGELRCYVRRRSGDPALDKGVCDAMLACAPKITKEGDIRQCMEPAMKLLVPTLPWKGSKARRSD